MKTALAIIGFLGALFCLYIMHSIIYYVLPEPYDQINLAVIITTVLLMRGTTIRAVTLGLSLSFIAELFSSSHFGLVTFSLLFTICIIHWLLRTVFTNNRWYIALIVGVVSIVTYQLFVVALNNVYDLIVIKNAAAITVPTMATIIDEIAINAVATLILWAIGKKFFKERRAQYDAL